MWLKRRTPQNIVIGGAAGAFPPAIAWIAAGGPVGWEAFVLFAIIFVWTPPHFWALGLFRSGDYARAGVPMLPVVKGAAETKRQILAYAMRARAARRGTGPCLALAGSPTASSPIVLGAAFVVLAVPALADRRATALDEEREAKRLFGFSILYLFALYAVLLDRDRECPHVGFLRGRASRERSRARRGGRRPDAGAAAPPTQPVRRARAACSSVWWSSSTSSRSTSSARTSCPEAAYERAARSAARDRPAARWFSA